MHKECVCMKSNTGYGLHTSKPSIDYAHEWENSVLQMCNTCIIQKGPTVFRKAKKRSSQKGHWIHPFKPWLQLQWLCANGPSHPQDNPSWNLYFLRKQLIRRLTFFETRTWPNDELLISEVACSRARVLLDCSSIPSISVQGVRSYCFAFLF